MSEQNIKESKRMELICEYLKTGKQPDGFKIIETKTGKYRLSKIKNDKEILEAKRKRLQKSIEEIDNELKKLENSQNETENQPQQEQPQEQA